MTKTLTSEGDGTTEEVQTALKGLFHNVILASLATTDEKQTPHINVCYFAADEAWRLFFLSNPESLHAQNLAKNAACALTVFDSTQGFGTVLKGCQLFGTARQLSLLESAHAFSVYAKRFPELLKGAANLQALFAHLESRFFEVTLTSGKVLDEPVFGKEVLTPFSIK